MGETILFNKPLVLGDELELLGKVVKNMKFCGDGLFTKECSRLLEENTGAKKALLTTSCTHALEMCALLLDIKEGDEVIMPSYTFVSTANAFVLRGARIVFVDIRPDTMNIDENKIEAAITKKTKCIVPVHYAGVSCEMKTICEIAKHYSLAVVEDAAQGVGASYNGVALGSIGDLGAYSFHETKNYQCGEGGALLIQNEIYSERAEIIREKGTNRTKFLRGEVDKYSWVDIGSSYLPSELNAAFLMTQLQSIEKVRAHRVSLWECYYNGLRQLKDAGAIELPYIPKECEQNGHMFYIKCADIVERQSLMNYLKEKKIQTAFHYIPLHSSVAGSKFGYFSGDDVYTTKESERLLRLPMHYDLTHDDVQRVTEAIIDFYSNKGY